MKIVVNRSKGTKENRDSKCGYKLSKEACDMLGVTEPYSFYNQEERTNQKLIEVIEFLQERANGDTADLRVVEVPDTLESVDENGHRVRHWHLSETAGFEVIRENHRFW
jgi:hypothetical protein